MYAKVEINEPPTQGDIIDDCPFFTLDVADSEIDLTGEPTRWKSRCVILTQSCNLVQAKTTKVVVAPITEASTLVESGMLRANVIRDQIRRSLVFGWYFLPAWNDLPKLPESIVDLRDVHTVSMEVIRHLISQNKRICRIQTPWREHMAQHFGVTYSRIGLPEPYGTEK